MRGSRIFFVRGGGGGGGGGLQAPQLILQFTERSSGFIAHFPGGGLNAKLDPHMENVAFWHE